MPNNNKIIVGVHGIGDQVRYETIQAITYQFCRFYKIQTAAPLGSFYNSEHNGILVLQHGTANARLYLTEAYWADISRKPETEGYVLEETKQWVRTIVERFRAQVNAYQARSSIKARAKPGDNKNWMQEDTVYLARGKSKPQKVWLNYRMIRSVLYEAIDTLKVMEKLLFILDKSSIFKFDLNRLLTNFLGDVQVVAEFDGYRKEILDRFIVSIAAAYRLDKEADIYIVAHSEGTVVAFLALLEAMQKGEVAHPWLKNIKGFMTLGSPIDKHLTLWPQLWDGLGELSRSFSSKNQIQWRNYYDYGDPVGYELDSARAWLRSNCDAFDFQESHDYGFSRYYLPGKAHVDYWRDDEVFDNFIGGAVEKKSAIAAPQSNPIARLVSNIVPYLLIAAVLLFATYFLYKPILNIFSPDTNLLQLFSNIAGIAAILAGITVMARIPRLSRRPFWSVISIGLFGAFAVASCYLLDANVVKAINSLFYGISYIAVAAMVSVIAAVLGARYSSATSKPIVFLGGLAVLLPAYHLVQTSPNHPSLWPLFLGGAIFIYSWWLAIQLFDLVFVWHWYIRNSKALERLRELQA
jgi:fluoride ion exporter CrcB/FEX